MKSDVYFSRFTAEDPNKMMKMKTLLEAAKFGELINPRDLIAIKVHVGEGGCKTYMDPGYIGEAVKICHAGQAFPFITDTAVLYRSRRSNAVEHIALASEHGFDLKGVGAPFFPADGLLGTQEVILPVKGKHYKEVPIAAAALEATSILVFSHVTGHLGSGMGATLKNLGMGFSSRKGKLSQHSNMKPRVKKKKCTDCGDCMEWCPEEAISNPDGFALIDASRCIGCGQCLAVCRFDAVAFNWKVSALELQERMVEHALGIMLKKRDQILFVNLLEKVTKDCDCLGDAGKPITPDIGAIASADPVAIDQAALDLVVNATGKKLSDLAYPGLVEDHQIKYAEKLGLGQRDYQLVEI